MSGYDVAILSDLRFPGGDAAGVVAEVRVQAAAGLSTVLVHVPLPDQPDARPFPPGIVGCLRDGLADLAHDGDRVDARLAVIRGPRILTAATVPPVRAERAVVVADEPLTGVREAAERSFGPDVTWAPATPAVRAALRRADPGLPLARADWHDIVDTRETPAGPGDPEVRVCLDAPEPDRAMLRAMAAGVPVVAGEHLRGVLGDAACYAGPGGVTELVRTLRSDPARYRRVARRGREFAERRYGGATHLSRLGLRPSRPVPPPRPAPAPARRSVRVLLLGDHLDRLLAIARRLPGDVQPVVVTGSSELPAGGLLTEYLPGRAALDMSAARWSGYLRDRLRHLVEVHRARAVVLDGPPHDGVLAATADRPDVAWLWIRAAMWRRGTGTEWRGRASAFDAVLEPGEFAAAGDEGWTVADGTPVTRVPPITELDPGELLDRAAARATLGLADDEPALLLRGVPVTVPGFRVIEPAGPAVRAADLAVAGAGYTTFHELLAARVPTVFVPDRAPGTDDQLARARFAAAAGAALCAEPGADLGDALTVAARPEVRAALARRCAELAFGNGAAEAAAWIGAHCGVPARIGA